MLDFRRRSRSRNYLQLPQQRKLLGMMVAAGLVGLLVSMAGEPKRWEWILAGRRAGQQVNAANFAADRPSDAAKPTEYYLPGLRTELLQSVRDDTVFRKSEADAWFHLFQLLDKTDDKQLAKASLGNVSFRQLYAQPRAYRGRVVTVEGMVRGAAKKTSPTKSDGINEYYQLSIEPDGEPGQLIVVYALKLPEGFPLGDRLEEPAALQGFFFKRWAYAASDAVRTAPLILAQTIAWQPQSTAQPITPNPSPLRQGRGEWVLWSSPLLPVLFALGLFSIVAVSYALLRKRRRQPNSEARLSPEALAAMSATDSADAVQLPQDGV